MKKRDSPVTYMVQVTYLAQTVLVPFSIKGSALFPLFASISLLLYLTFLETL